MIYIMSLEWSRMIPDRLVPYAHYRMESWDADVREYQRKLFRLAERYSH